MALMTVPEFPDAPVGVYNTAVDLLERNLSAGRAGKVAFVDDSGTYTYGDLAERVDRCAGALLALGLVPGDRLILGLLDSIDFPTCFLGAIKAGIVPVPINTMFLASDCAYVLANSGAAAAIVSQPLLAAYRTGAEEAGWTGTFVVANGVQTGMPELTALLAAADPVRRAAPTHAEDVCFWLYSSGSTGKPKGTLHRHASMTVTAELFARQVLDLREGDVVFSAAKLFFAYGLGNGLSFPMAVGATTVLMAERAKPDAVVATLLKHNVTVFCGVPTLFSGLLAANVLPERGTLALRLCTSAGEALPLHVGQSWRERTGVDIIDGIGSTEMLHIFVSTRPGAVTYGVTGKPVPGYRVRLVDESGAEVERGELGELLVLGPSAFTQYWNEHERTTRAFEGAWVRTGDKFFETDGGDLVHCGRTDDMIKSGGIWVSPMEVESVIIGHEAVLDVAVIGVADENELVKPKAFVVLRDGFTGDAELVEKLQAYVKARLAPYKFPRWIDFVEELPKTATGKTQRHILRRREADAKVTSSPQHV